MGYICMPNGSETAVHIYKFIMEASVYAGFVLLKFLFVNVSNSIEAQRQNLLSVEHCKTSTYN